MYQQRFLQNQAWKIVWNRDIAQESINQVMST